MVLLKLFCQIACNCAHNQHAIHINLALVSLSQIKWRTIRLKLIFKISVISFSCDTIFFVPVCSRNSVLLEPKKI